MVCTHVDLCIYQGEGVWRHRRRRTKVHCTIYFNPSVMIAFLNLHTEPHHLLLQTASSGHSIEILFDCKSSFHRLIPSSPSPLSKSENAHWLGKELCPLPEKNEGKNSTWKKKTTSLSTSSHKQKRSHRDGRQGAETCVFTLLLTEYMGQQLWGGHHLVGSTHNSRWSTPRNQVTAILHKFWWKFNSCWVLQYLFTWFPEHSLPSWKGG